MNEFIYYILHELKRGAKWAIVAGIIYVLLAYIVYRLAPKKTDDTCSFKWKNHIPRVLFCGYLVIVLYAVLARDPVNNGLNVNLHWFLAVLEAWNSCSLKNWINILINVVMYVPFGILLPYLGKMYKKWYVVFFTGTAFSLVTEGLQYFFGVGVFDVDDLLANVLGIAMGYSVSMLCLTFFSEKKKQIKLYAFYALPLIVPIVFVASIFAFYEIKNYGNLEDAASFSVNTRNTTFTLQCSLENNEGSIYTYQGIPYTKDTCEVFGNEFFKNLGAKYDEVMYYDNMVSFMCHTIPAHFLDVYYRNGAYHYIGTDGESIEGVKASEEEVRDALMALDIVVPPDAVFSYEDYGWHQFSSVRFTDEAGIMTDGIIRCRYTSKGTLCEIVNEMATYEPYKVEDIVSPADAYERMCNGYISDGEYFEYNKPTEVKIVSCELGYQIDTKGFYQPVYIFELSYENGALRKTMVPALK